ncbi:MULTISPECIES: right-handed parallel beta-helix repeat-containing protein [unclassified Luteimonas]|uniref:right-handed parallel beta-helix repeat-containing protein n=1 Tax=unclassified Luteimonas TaxID=2629088 RepID=UPI0018F0ABE5|nr:right-handed parallel beta-helix repeat-containing protein [Luteimonas sp. MC1572]MBJ6982866.1 right-handed parallel beta-helix repeat-containing protein [Luteimonas sp. MC1572]MBJ7574530.1 right-handed parallel beta-helix repeat-containing protein [Luteimonas sp. MC1828]QQO04094.1 right-handed parallel beta-helix repeat-containing protein [Luteimonas sp. MC1572]
MAAPANAAEWFVSPTGNDSSGNGSIGSPFRTVKRVLSTTNGVVSAGDTVTLRGGATYNECDVRLRKPLTLRSYPGERAHIHCDVNTPDSVTIQIDPGASGSRLSNLEISGGRYYAVMLQTSWYQGGPSSNKGAENVVLEDLLIRDTGRDGIKVTPKSNNATIRRVEIRNTGKMYPAGTSPDAMNADGIDNVNGSGMLVEDSYIHDIATTGLYFKGGAADVVVQRNRIENTGMAGILVGFDTSTEFFDLQLNPQYYESIRGTVRNNVVRNTQYAGIGLYAAKDALVANNTIVNAARKGHGALYFGVPFQDWDPLAGRPASVNPKLVNNLVIQDGGNCIDIRYSGELGGLSGLSGSANSNYNGFHNASCTFRDSRPGSGLTTAGTLGQWRSATGQDANSKLAAFSVNATGHIAAGSPAIGGGIPLSQVVHDIDMHVRGTSNDIGADQLAGGTTPPPTTNPPRRNRLKTPTATLPPVATPPRPRLRGPVDTGTPPARTPARPGISNPTLTTSAPAEAASDVVITSPAAAAWKTVGSWIDGAKQKLSAD